MKMEAQDTWDSYFYEGTDTLKNKFNISSKDELLIAEKKSTLSKLTYLHINPIIKDGNAQDLKNIHKFVFGDVYEWAGEYRTCSMSKNRYNFLEPELINTELENTINNYSVQISCVQSIDQYAFVLAPFYYDLIRVHPFREGNGRTIREFLREFVLLKNQDLLFDVELDYTKIDKNNLMLGTQQRYLYPSLLETEFLKGLVPLEKENVVKK